MKRTDYNFATIVKATTQKGADIIDTTRRAGRGDIYDAYERPSATKVRTYRAIEERANDTEGYNNDLRVCGAGIQQYSTIYTFTEGGKTYAVKDTSGGTYIVEM